MIDQEIIVSTNHSVAEIRSINARLGLLLAPDDDYSHFETATGELQRLCQLLANHVEILQAGVDYSNLALGYFQQLEEISSVSLANPYIVLDMVLDMVIKISEAKRACLIVRDSATQTMAVQSARDKNGVNIPSQDIFYSHRIVEKTLSTGQSVIVEDAAIDPDLRDSASVRLGQLRSVLCIHLSLQGTTIGFLYADDPFRRGTFNPSMLDLLQGFANQAAITLQNIQLFEQIKAERDRALHLAAKLQQAQDDLQRSNTELRLSRERIVIARDEERRQLAHRLHDDVNQTLYGMVLKIDSGLQTPEEAEKIMLHVQNQVQEMMKYVRDLSYELHPPALKQLGLVGALNENVKAFQTQTGGKTRIRIHVSENLPPIQAATEIALYRIALAALDNVVKHARAKNCQVTVDFDGTTLQLVITDDGHGLRKGSWVGNGLESMVERAAELGGECKIQSRTPERGTQVLVSIPYSSEAK